ncbi:MAG TPA: helix-turn-helix domain-containing protein [Terriglobales bacterium]|jgi:AcrR family transcriptional regulator
MPRQADPQLGSRILEAARRLWHRGGEESLNMRAVAKAAQTNTPAVYRRFRNRNELLRALVGQYQMDLFRALEPCRSFRQFAECYFDFALQRPREYELIMSGLLARVKSRPNFDLLLERSAQWLGGASQDHRQFAIALASLAHGAVLHAITGNLPTETSKEIRLAFTRSVELLVKNAGKLGN